MSATVQLVRLPTGARIPDVLREIALNRGWPAAVCTGIGGVSDVELAYYSLDTKSYCEFFVEGVVELVSLHGNLTGDIGDPFWHLHAIVADQSGRCFGGHLNSCKVALTVEIAVWPMLDYHLRTFDPELGLRLLRDREP